MAYTTSAQVLSYCGRLQKSLSSTSQPNTAGDLTTFINDRAETIDAALKSRGLTVPVTTPAEFVSELAALNAKGAAGDMMNAAYITNDTNDRGAGALYLKEFLARVGQLYQGIGIPVGVAITEPDLAPRSLWTDSGAVGGAGPAGGDSSTPGWEWNDAPTGGFPTGTDQFGQPVSGAPIFSIGRRF